MAKVQVRKAGITLSVEEIAVDWYLRTGYKVVKAKPAPPPAKPAILKVQVMEPVDDQPVPESPAVEKPKRKTRKKKAE